jgi:adenosylhomocysteine nucleosidase
MIVDGISILTLIAAQEEYGVALKAIIPDAKIIGVGPIESAFNTTKILMSLGHQNMLPDIIFSVGTAGSAILDQAELYQISSVTYRDMDCRVFGFEKGVTPFVNYPAEIQLPVLFDDIPTANLSSGAMIIAKQAEALISFKDIPEDCVDMETYSIARIGYDFKIPVIGLRGISDGKENVIGIKSWENYLSFIDEKISHYCKRMLTETTNLMNIISHYKINTDND